MGMRHADPISCALLVNIQEKKENASSFFKKKKDVSRQLKKKASRFAGAAPPLW